MTPSPILLAGVFFGTGTVLPKSFMGALSSNSRLDVRKSVSALSRYFGMKFLWLEIGKKIDNLDIRPL